MISRVQKALAAIFTGQFFGTLSTIVLVPLYLARWTPAVYGEWLALSSVAAYLGTLDFGLNTALLNRLTQDYARQNWRGFHRAADSAFSYQLALSAVGTLFVGALAFLVPVPRWVGLHVVDQREAACLLTMMGAFVLWSIPGALIYGLHRIAGDNARSHWWGTAGQLLGNVLVALALLCGAGIKIVAGVMLVPLLLTPVVAWDVYRKDPRLIPRIRRPDRAVLRELLRPSAFFFLILLATALSLQGPVLIVSSVLGGVAVAVFVTCRTLANVIRMLVTSLQNAIWPDITSMEARGEYSKLAIVFLLLIIASSTLSVAIASALWFQGGPLISVWTHHKLQPDLLLLRLLLLQLLLQAPWIAGSAMCLCTNNHKVLAIAYAGSTIIAVSTAAVLVRYIGSPGIPLAFILGEAIACYHLVIKNTCMIVQVRYGRFARRMWLGYMRVAAPTMGAAYLANKVLIGPVMLQFGEIGLVTTVVSLLSAWYLWITPELRENLVERLAPGLRAGKRHVAAAYDA